MYLSTSNFRTELKVIGLVLLVLLCVEIGVRAFERRMAVGFHTPNVAEQAATAEGPGILVLGNSLIRNGVDVGLIEKEMRGKGVSPIHVDQAYLVAATSSDWYYIFKHSFIDSDRRPDTLVVCFAYNYLQDAPIQRSYIAHNYSGVSDIPQLFSEEIQDFDGRAEFLLFKASLSFSERKDLHRRASDVIIPHYRDSALRINNALRPDSPAYAPNDPTYRYLERLIKIASENNVKLILVAMPTQKSYEIHPQVNEILQMHGVPLIDNRRVEGLTSQDFGDDSHLIDSGKAFFSRILAAELREQLRR